MAEPSPDDPGPKRRGFPDPKRAAANGLSIAALLGVMTTNLWFAPGWANGWPVGPDRRDLFAFTVCSFSSAAVAALGLGPATFIGSWLDDPGRSSRSAWIGFSLFWLAWATLGTLIAFGPYTELHDTVGWPTRQG